MQSQRRETKKTKKKLHTLKYLVFVRNKNLVARQRVTRFERRDLKDER